MGKRHNELHPSLEEVFVAHSKDTRSPSWKQIGYMMGRCREHGKTAADLIEEAIRSGRIHKSTPIPCSKLAERQAGEELYALLTMSQAGALFAVVRSWTEPAYDRTK